ncbi:ABC transporter ATP-binding protein [Cytobacillus solani]|uniref:ABC transporter ATP-binding protein n=1 Tax=Cytobacillus solani TaxID=1637975 RepID=UPI0015EFC401|nr:ABC transporter ATP-binding protein [Cytobacillus solani]
MLIKEFAKKNKGKISFVLFLGIISTLLFLLIPIANKNIIDNGIPSNEKSVLLLSVGLFFISLISAEVLQALKRVMVTYLENSYSLFLRQKIHVKVRNLEVLNTFSNGSLISHHINDINLIKQKLRKYFDNIINFIQIISIFVLVSLINIKFLFIVILIIPIYALLPKVLGKKITEQSSIVQKCLEQITEVLNNSYKISKEIRIFQKEDWDYKRTENKLRSIIAPVVKLDILNNLFVVGQLLYSVFLCTLFYFAAIMVQQNLISIGTLFALTSYIGFVAGPVQAIVYNFGTLKSIDASEARINVVLNSKERMKHKEKKILSNDINIKFSEVKLNFGEKLVFKNISFEVSNGSFVGIIGKSGCGKTSILNIIAKLCKQTEGKVLINNTDIKSIGDTEYYGYIKYVFQEGNFIEGSLRENLFIDSDDIAKESFANKLIEDFELDFLSNNFEFKLENGGDNLSGGQKQRLALIRALISEPPILLLDEVTSALDSELSMKVLSIIKELRKEKITIFVTHSRELLKNSNLVFRMENGNLEVLSTFESSLLAY